MSGAKNSLKQLMDKVFNLSDLKVLCFELDIDHETLHHAKKQDLIIDLIAHCEKNGRIPDLLTACNDKRPTNGWPSASDLLRSNDDVKNVWDEDRWRLDIERYYASLVKKVGFVRILGRMEAEPLENVFTHVNVLDRPTADRRYNIEHLLENFSPRDFEKLGKVERVPGEAAVAEYPKLFILGKPGAGKTTFLKHTALRAINHEIKKVPIFVTLKELADSGKEITDFILHQLTVHRLPEPEAFMQSVLQSGNAIVLFDGLDEVNLADNQRSQMIQRLNDFVYQYSKCSILITSRVAATDYSFTQFEYVEMADFDKGQIGRYIDKWFVGDEEKRKNCRHALLENPDNKAVRELAQVPLLLALLCLVYEERNEIPPERHEIYYEATRALLSKWDSSRNISRDTMYQQLSLDRKQKMLATIAAQTFEKGDYFLKEHIVVDLIGDYLQGVPGLEDPDAALVLQTMEAQHGIFVERARGIHSFSHLTLQEYYTARYIVDNQHNGTVRRLMQHLGDDRWREVFLLVAGMLDDATEFGEAYLAAAHQLIADDTDLVNLIDWAEQKRTQLSPVRYRPAAMRAFLLSLVRGRDLNYDLNHAFDFDLARTRAIDRDRDLALDRDRDLALDLAYALARDLDLALDRDLERGLDLVLAREVANPDLALARALLVSEAYGIDAMTRELMELTAPKASDESEVRRSFIDKFTIILENYEGMWSPYALYKVVDEDAERVQSLSRAQIDKLINYFETVHFLARCLKIAYLMQRDTLLDKFLLISE